MFSNTLTKEGYKLIIENYIQPFIANYPRNCTLIQDNCSCHSSPLCLNLLNRLKISRVNSTKIIKIFTKKNLD